MDVQRNQLWYMAGCRCIGRFARHSKDGSLCIPMEHLLGAFKVSSELFGWKNKRTGDVIQHRSSDISTIAFLKTNSNTYQLRIELNESKGHKVLRFDGFTEKVRWIRCVCELEAAHVISTS
ncbi:hypothetical protein BEWA_003290 [Theileria equi strain WA]|uniref:FACT complex subunit SSRP1/POB3 N-terminal PH domain-containing protein n=1 Tax=Theileria equi strain WA TaxID=1537102 RepID=L0B120_THEEQ|nr:hypothetical protein BEWA_003290 [Theileria equi strain WA]AFZ80921.1 hypothetical protein BEWA_003290 [Theileria equi strain WA]|eukprot:XP_004830587.1 hypothetical protein BEWA_003290 [Theileria equi strain WA]